MKRFLILTMLLIVGLTPMSFATSEPSRSFELTYAVSLEEIPDSAKSLRLWVPLATSDRNQIIQSRVVESEIPYWITQDSEYGNDILYVDLDAPLPKMLDLVIRYEAQVRSTPYLKVTSNDTQLSFAEQQKYLSSKNLMVVDQRVIQIAQEVTANANSSLEKARAIYDYVIGKMAYDKKTPGWGQGDTLRACDVAKGNCTDFHSLFISLARASGVPARFQIGTPLPTQSAGEIAGYHCWAEFYVEEIGWVPVDASEAWKDREKLEYFFGTYDANRLAISTGRDIQLGEQAAKGTRNIFFYPYVEVDGESFDGVKAKFRFQDIASTAKGDQDA